MTRTQKVGNFAEPFKREDRERKPLAGLEDHFELTRTGLVWSMYAQEWVESAAPWPYIKLVHEGRIVDINLLEALALSWLTVEQRQSVREALPAGAQGPKSPELLALEQSLGVSLYALSWVTTTPSDAAFTHEARLASPEGGDAATLQVMDAAVEKYDAHLFEHHRPPSKGGNTKALHTHVLVIGGEKYSFFALGSKKWVFANDTVSFAFRVTDKGYRNVDRDSIFVRDKAGAPVVRGERGFKAVLRTSATKLPGSRREQR